MTAEESKKPNKASLVYWRGDAADSGTITETSWDAVTINWNNGHVARVHHGDMRKATTKLSGAFGGVPTLLKDILGVRKGWPTRSGARFLPTVPSSLDALRLARRHCDGVRLHAFCTRAYAEQVVMPEIEKGLYQSGRKRENFEVAGGGFIVTGPDEEALAKGRERVRRDIGIYGSTPAYQPVLELHGLGDLAKKLNNLVHNGDWEKLAAQIPDDVVDLFAAVGTFEELPKKVAARFGGISDTINVGFSLQSNAAAVSALVRKLQAIPRRFTGYSRHWAIAS